MQGESTEVREVYVIHYRSVSLQFTIDATYVGRTGDR